MIFRAYPEGSRSTSSAKAALQNSPGPMKIDRSIAVENCLTPVRALFEPYFH
jgi:hypothetical protein